MHLICYPISYSLFQLLMICKVLQRKISHIFMIMISCLRFFTLLMNKAWANDPKVKLHHIYLPSLIPKLEASLGINCYRVSLLCIGPIIL